MKKILNLARNDLKIEFAERSTLFFFLVLPLVFTAILGVSLGGNSNPDADTRFTLPVIDLDRTDLSHDLIAELENSEVIRPEIATREEADQSLKDGDVAAILTIRAGFEESLLSGNSFKLALTQSPNDPNTLAIEQAIYTASGKVGNAVSTAINALEAAEQISPFANEAARQSYFEESLKLAKETMQTPSAHSEITRASEAPRTSFTSFELSSAGQLVTWTLITLLGASEVFVNERVGGTLRRLLSTPTKKATVLMGKITGRFGMGLLQMAALIIGGALLFNVHWGNSPLALAMVVVAFGLAAVALGVMLGAFARTRSQASGLTVMFSMVMAALGGAWWQLEITPPLYQKVVQVIPSTWAMKGFNEVLVLGGGPREVLMPVIVLLGFAAIFFAVGVRRLRFE